VTELRDGLVALRPWREEDRAVKVPAFSDSLVQRFSWPHESS